MGYKEHLVAISLLLTIFFFAVYSMWVMSERNGYFNTLRLLRDQGPHVLPGSTIPLLQKYTGISIVDYYLTVLQCVFANVTDGSAPHLSLFAFYFLGQLTPVITGMVVESQRSFNQGKTASWFIFWVMACQCLGFGIVMPIYALLHLSTTSRFAATTKHTFGTGLQTLPQAVIFGLLLPSILHAIPFTSSILHQKLVVAWQFFPFYISAFMFINKSFINNSPTTPQIRSQLATIYKFGESVALWSHRLAIATLILIKLRPHYFPSYLIEPLTFSNVFLPPLPFSSAKVGLIDGASTFFKYNMFNGFLAAIVWQFSISDVYLHVDVVFDVLAKGPGYTVMRISDLRDQLLFEIVQAEEEKAVKEGYSDSSWVGKLGGKIIEEKVNGN